MSGLPGGEPGAQRPNWIVNAWNSAALDVLDYQWDIAADFWRETDRLAADHGVKVALELHPQNLIFNSADVHKLIELTKRSEEHTSELQSRGHLVCRLLLEKKNISVQQ